jgi:hypothetical protein
LCEAKYEDRQFNKREIKQQDKEKNKKKNDIKSKNIKVS